MIVKNENHVIERCLDSVKSFVNFVLIEDTGSEDGTQKIVENWLARNHVPGQIYSNAWVNFAHNRSSALARLRLQADLDYALVMDADDVFVIENPARFSAEIHNLSSSAYRIKLSGGGAEYFRTQLVSNQLEFEYKGVLHEFIESPGNLSPATLSHCFIQSNREGARSKDPKKYEKDAAVLRQALAVETDPFLISRYTFYLAQSLRDSGNIDEAIKFYRERASLGFWNEERYVGLVYAARMMDNSATYPSADIVSVFNQAIDLLPTRVEAFHGLARHYRLKKLYAQAVEVARRGSLLPLPSEGLFIETSLYKFGIKDELAVSAYWAGDKALCLHLCTEILDENSCSPDQLDRIVKNGDFAVEFLQNQIDQFQKSKAKLAASNKPCAER